MSNEIPPPAPAPTRGSYAIDTRSGRIGQVMDHHAGHVQLRPPQGGLEWNCPPELIRAATDDEVLRARVAQLNALSRAESRWSR
ncbi:hypothetical protein AB0K09_24865 [Streptomyces sp. NPDC049577]|uniref:hypothetical protein n=1 Tax=Streptomyces sp. NPDC049577 TaxID=3155153 RepID=UPI0034388CCC